VRFSGAEQMAEVSNDDVGYVIIRLIGIEDVDPQPLTIYIILAFFGGLLFCVLCYGLGLCVIRCTDFCVGFKSSDQYNVAKVSETTCQPQTSTFIQQLESSDSESFENFSNDPESELEIFEEPQHDNKSVLVTASVETSNNLEVVSDSVSDTSTPSSISTMKNEEIESLKSSSISEVPSFLLKSSNDLNLDTNIPELADDEKRHQFQDRIKMFNQIQN